jgi:hypothetical protein
MSNFGIMLLSRMANFKKSIRHQKPTDPFSAGISSDRTIGVWEFYMSLKVVVNTRSRNVRYYLSFGVKSKQMYFYDYNSGKRRRVARKSSALYQDVLDLLDDWRFQKLARNLLE